jgi:hypothetical protein
MQPMRKFLAAIVLLAGVVFIISKFAELEKVAATLQRGDWRFLILALIAEAVWMINIAACFRTIYQMMGIEERLGRLVLMSAAANFVNIVAPSAGMGGIAVFIAEARRKNYSAGRATVVTTLFLIFDYTAFLGVLGLGLFVLFRRDKLTTTEIVSSAIFVLIALSLGSILYLGSKSEKSLGRLLAWVARLVNRAARPFRRSSGPYLSEERAHTFAREMAEGIQSIRAHPRELLLPLLLAASSKAIMISIFFLCFLAFQVPVSVGTIIAGYSIAFLFMIVSVTPSGVGFVEGILTLVLVSFYIPLEEAAVATIAYRGITFWAPLLFGMLAFQWMGRLGMIEKARP